MEGEERGWKGRRDEGKRRRDNYEGVSLRMSGRRGEKVRGEERRS